MRLCHEFTFDAAHYLPGYKGKCALPHGHTYKLEIVVEGNIKSDGMVVDFSTIKRVVEHEVLQHLDHRQLNDMIPHPTVENIVKWIEEHLQGKLPVSSIKLWEGPGKWVEITVAKNHKK